MLAAPIPSRPLPASCRRRLPGALSLLSLLALVLGATLVGCKTTAASAGVSTGTFGKQLLRLRGTPPYALRYDVKMPADLDPLQGRLFDQIRAAAGDARRVPPTTDHAAVAATLEVCRGLPATGPPPAALVDFGLRLHGLIDPPPHLVVADIPAGAIDAIAQRLRQRFAHVLRRRSYRRVGMAACRPLLTPQRRRVVVTLFEGRARVEPLARVLALGQTVSLRAKVAASHREVQLVVANPRGVVRSERMVAQGGTLIGSVRCRLRGTYRAELTGYGPHGTEVLANFPLYCDRKPPTSLVVAAGRPALLSAGDVERRIVELTNALRVRAGLSALKTSRALSRVARAHSKDMQASDFVGHVSPKAGGPADRMRRAKLPFLVVRENVARAYSAQEALDQLAQSPAHLSNLLNTDTTEIGVGVVIDHAQSIAVLLITQNFLAPAKRYVQATAVADALGVIATLRRRQRVASLKVQAKLSALAVRYLQDYLSAGGVKQADARLSRALRGLGGRYKRVGGLLLKVGSLEAIARAKELQRPAGGEMGIAVRRDLAKRVVVFILIGEGAH